MILVPWLIGKAVTSLLYWGKEKQDCSYKDCFLVGWMITIGLAEAAHLFGVFLGRPFCDCVKLFWAADIGLGTVAVLALILYFAILKKGSFLPKKQFVNFKDSKEVIPFALFLILFFVQCFVIIKAGEVYITGDMTVETVQSFLCTDSLYQVNPMTGTAYVAGMPLRLKILGLPTLFGSICKVVPFEASFVIRRLIPLGVLVAFYMVYGTLADIFFSEMREWKYTFLTVVALLLFVSNAMYGLDGFDLLHSGFRGVTIKACVLVPYTISLCLRKKWPLVVLCVLAEGCIVWTLYGMGTCLLVAAVMVILRLARRDKA